LGFPRRNGEGLELRNASEPGKREREREMEGRGGSAGRQASERRESATELCSSGEVGWGCKIKRGVLALRRFQRRRLRLGPARFGPRPAPGDPGRWFACGGGPWAAGSVGGRG
jgi:hypothetical protein